MEIDCREKGREKNASHVRKLEFFYGMTLTQHGANSENTTGERAARPTPPQPFPAVTRPCVDDYCFSVQALPGPTAACIRSYHGLTLVSAMISPKAAVRSIATRQPKTQTSAKSGS